MAISFGSYMRCVAIAEARLTIGFNKKNAIIVSQRIERTVKLPK